jgi:hypothetical protein
MNDKMQLFKGISLEISRFNFRAVVRGVTFFAMAAKTQTLEGITSFQKDGGHIVLFDLENCSLQQATESLRYVQEKYDLSDIYVVSDCENSYRAWCFSKADFVTYMKILLDTKYLDYNFLYYTFKRRKATLRTGRKKGRPPQKVVSVLRSYPVAFPSNDTVVEKVVYDTGLQKRGFSILLGGE